MEREINAAEIYVIPKKDKNYPKLLFFDLGLYLARYANSLAL